MEGTDIKPLFVGKFYGPEKISDVSVIETTTPSGAPIFEITTEQGRTYVVPQKSVALIVTDEAKDWNHIRDARIRVMVPEIINIISEYDLPGGQMNYLLSMVGAEFDNHFGRAHNYLWFKDDKRYVPGFDPANEFTLLMADRINDQIPERTDVVAIPLSELDEDTETEDK